MHHHRLARTAAIAFAFVACTSCGGPDRSAREKNAKPFVPPTQTAVVSGFDHPESARYDSADDVFFVSNIGGDPTAKDDNGFISRVRPDGTIDSLHFIQAGRGGVTLNAPKGLAITGDTLWTADIDAVRGFDLHTGTPVATIDLATQRALFLNDIAVGPDGALYITDTGLRSEHGAMVHPAGTDRVFRIAPDHVVSVALASDDLDRPNGITWDVRGQRFIIVSFGGASIFAWRPGDRAPQLIGHNSPRMDGVEMLPDGRMVVTSWQDSSLTIRSAGNLTVVKGFPSPADIGVDTRRMHVAIPLLQENRVDIWSIPPLTADAVRDRSSP